MMRPKREIGDRVRTRRTPTPMEVVGVRLIPARVEHRQGLPGAGRWEYLLAPPESAASDEGPAFADLWGWEPEDNLDLPPGA